MRDTLTWRNGRYGQVGFRAVPPQAAGIDFCASSAESLDDWAGVQLRDLLTKRWRFRQAESRGALLGCYASTTKSHANSATRPSPKTPRPRSSVEFPLGGRILLLRDTTEMNQGACHAFTLNGPRAGATLCAPCHHCLMIIVSTAPPPFFSSCSASARTKPGNCLVVTMPHAEITPRSSMRNANGVAKA